MIKLIYGDCIEKMDKIIDKGIKVDAIICDLPYFNIVDDAWDNIWKTKEEYLNWVNENLIRYKNLLLKMAVYFYLHQDN